MIYPSHSEFLQLAEKSNLVPVSRTLLADLETPISLYQKLCSQEEHAVLLESAEGSGTVARYSFLGYEPLVIFQSSGSRVEITRKEKKEVILGNPWQILRQEIRAYQPAPIPGLPRFWGGAVGYFAYDLVQFLEELPEGDSGDWAVPDSYLIFPRVVLSFDHYTHQVRIIVNTPAGPDPERNYREAVSRLEEVCNQIRHPAPRPVVTEIGGPMYVSANMDPGEFMARVERVKEYIRAGDAFQVVLSRRLEAPIRSHPFAVYRVLRTINPSPYMFYLNFGELKLAGSSPEPLVRLEGKLVQTRPIAGTRPRGKTETEDRELEAELLKDPKERAEHIMLVGLARNDLGRVCRCGTVQVTGLMRVERFSHVMHLVSDVRGVLQENKDALDVLAACFPAGTVSGAPKVRAMEIIAELEPTRRGPYAGAVGYIGLSGNMDTCITIRSILFASGRAYVQAGAGIVTDSIPEREYQETQAKAQALLRALEEAKGGIV